MTRVAVSAPSSAADVRPRAIDHVLVPLDGSPFAERAVPVAHWLAEEAGASLHLLEVVAEPAHAGRAIHDIDLRARRHGADRWQVTADAHPAAAIVAAGATGSSLVCLATHGRDRSAALLGSVAAGVLAGSPRPVLLVGPGSRPPCARDAPVMAAVDTEVSDATVVRTAAWWATRLGRPLLLATVAEPTPASFRDGHARPRAHGPQDPEGRLAALAGKVPAGCEVATRVEYEPISVRRGIVRAADRTTALLVLGAHRRNWAQRAVHGSEAARVVHDAEVPVLVVPVGGGG